MFRSASFVAPSPGCLRLCCATLLHTLPGSTQQWPRRASSLPPPRCSIGPYIAAEFAVEVPYIIAQSVMYAVIVYW